MEELRKEIFRMESEYTSKAVIKAKTFEWIVNRANIEVDPKDIFQEKFLCGNLMKEQRSRWEKEVRSRYLQVEYEEMRQAWDEFGAYEGMSDFGHTSPKSRLLLQIGFTGLLDRVEKASSQESLTEKQMNFYESCKIVLSAMSTAAKRLADAVKPYNKANSEALLHIAEDAPQNIYEAMQLLILYFFLHEYVAGTWVRTLGRLDVLLYPFYKKDL